jgi:hypothetical protein
MDTFTRPPWLQFPALTEDRLRAIAELIRDVRHQAVLTHEPKFGDDEWVLGVRSYKRICYEIAKASVGQYRAWLSVIENEERIRVRKALAPAVLNPELHFVFGIGGMPLRFYRGLADEQTNKSLKQHYPELFAYQHCLEFVAEPIMDRVLRLAVETDDLGQVTRVVLVQLDEDGIPHNPWTIPLNTTPKITQFRAVEKEKELEAPKVGSKRRREEDKQSS